MTKQIRQYGTWNSPISPRMMAAENKLNDVQWDTDGETLVWTQGSTLYAQIGIDAPRTLTDDEMPVRGRVGYGGGEFTVADGVVYFAGSASRLYRLSVTGGKPRAITPQFGSAAAPRVSADGKWIAFVHSYERKDCLAVVDTKGETWSRKLIADTDFVMQPAWHPAGTHLACITWNHPQMPWDGTNLRLLTLRYGQDGAPYVASDEFIAGSESVAVFQPEFSPDGRYIAYASDQTGWWQLYIYDMESKAHKAVTETEAEHGQPAWRQGGRVFGWSSDSRGVYFVRNQNGSDSLWHYDLRSNKETPVKALDEYTEIEQIAISSKGDSIAWMGSSPTISPRILTYTPEKAELPAALYASDTPSIQVIVDEPQTITGLRIRWRAGMENVPAKQLSKPQHIEWTGHDGGTAYGVYYPPASDRFESTGKPPLMVLVHGGPTSQRGLFYDIEAQFYATRGFAVLQVNHRGSTGYGKAYMNMLRGNWGLYDVEDSASGAQHLVNQGLADAGRLMICGGSAGGYTVLQSLVDKPGFYKAAVCRYGISNQFMLVQDTHKFEERYNDSLLGALPDAAELYRQRSPLFHAENIIDPVIIFQGSEDPVVPKNQSDAIVEKLKARNVPHEYHIYEGEGHGFRKPENIEAHYKAIMRFLSTYVIYA